MNSYFKTEEFNKNLEYQVCSNMGDQLKAYKMPRKRKKVSRRTSDTEKRRSSRIAASAPLDVGGNNNIGEKQQVSENTTMVELQQFDDSGGKKAVGHNEAFPRDVLDVAKKYRKQYTELSIQER